MSRDDRSVSPGDGHVAWDGSPRTIGAVREEMLAQAPAGALRLVLQQLALHEQGRETGRHETIDAITDVGGNLVTMSIGEALRADPEAGARLDAALDRLRQDVAADLGTAPDSLEVIVDADGTRRVMLVLSIDVSAQDLAADTPHPALHGGAHHISHHAPALDELRDRLAGPDPGPLRRAWDAVRRWRPAR
jgi:hypothetical protein